MAEGGRVDGGTSTGDGREQYQVQKVYYKKGRSGGQTVHRVLVPVLVLAGVLAHALSPVNGSWMQCMKRSERR